MSANVSEAKDAAAAKAEAQTAPRLSVTMSIIGFRRKAAK
jgi:hypothetical protein